MTLNGLLTSLGQIAIHDRLVNWAGAGTSIYQVNDLTQRDYPCFFASPTGTHRVENAYTTYQLSLFYFDRLLEDSSNDIDIQSTAIEVLKNIIKKAAFVDGIVAVDDEYTITLFVETERFKDRCSGAYATIEITIVNDSECVIYSNDEPEPEPPTPYETQYATLEIVSGGTLTWRTGEHETNKEIFISFDSGDTWESVTSTPEGTEISVEAGDTIFIKGYNDTYASWYDGVTFAGSTAIFNLSGNIMSLIYGDDFEGKTEFPEGTSHNLLRMFNYTGIIDASNLVLPPTALTDWCYASMFEGCVSLIKAPALPATELSADCYRAMFVGCTSLTEAPELPATTLAVDCYPYMFYGCSLLTESPVLPAATLVGSCYTYMFEGCTNLTKITCLAYEGFDAPNTTDRWTLYVSPTGTFIKHPNAVWGVGSSGIPEGWTVIDAEE